jgi:glycosyltransferase involved in cell wall biosynthesis
MMISIIIPTFNTANYLPSAIDSVLLNIAAVEYEVLVVDDGSTDNTREIIQSYIVKQSIRYISQENRGLAAARNTGIRAARGEYIVFLDSDDIILPEKLSIQSTYLDQHPEIDLVYSQSEWFIENDFSNTMSVNFPIYEGNVADKLFFGNFVHVNSVMVRKEKILALGLFDETLRELEDWDLWLRMVLSGSRFGFTPGVLSKVRLRRGSMTSNQQRMNSTMVRVLKKTINNLDKNHPLQIRAHCALVIYQLKAGETKGYLKALYKLQLMFGWQFMPIVLKQSVKYMLRRIIKQNQTTSEIEKIWKTGK